MRMREAPGQERGMHLHLRAAPELRVNVDLRRKLDSDDKAPERDRIGAFMDYDQQGVALFLGGGNVLIIQDDGTTQGNATELTDIQRAVLDARLRKIAHLITTGQLS